MNPYLFKNRVRAGFTLVELMLVIAIIGVLAGLSLAVLRGAQEDAKKAATRARIRVINEILKVEMEEYEVRRLPISVAELVSYAQANPIRTGGGILTQVRNLRRRIMQEIIHSEMPRPVLDNNGNFVYNPDLGIFPSNIPGVGTGALGFADWLDQEYPLIPSGFGVTLRNRLAGLSTARIQYYARFNPILTGANVYENINLPGELLYLMLEQINVDGERALEILGDNAIDDSDGDTFLEIVDAFDEPMLFALYQVDVEPGFRVDPSVQTDVDRKDIYPDFNEITKAPGADPDFDTTVPTTGLPLGYDVLNPTIPREMGKIRFEIFSTELGRDAGER